MQTFLPYSSFVKTAKCLDYRRLGKQRVEAKQILDLIEGRVENRWKNHPAVKMWMGYNLALRSYYNAIVEEWIERGYNNNMPIMEINKRIVFPYWLGDENFHRSHRSNLTRKKPEYYSKFWCEKNDLEYVWPEGEKQ